MLIGFFIVTACQDKIDQLNEEKQPLMDLTVCEDSFAQVLSQAVANSADLRAFIKKEALSQFDKDYDVFYPWIKNRTVSGEKTFRDLLLQYMDEKKLSEIEKSLPLLTIYVPDYSWIGAFCPEKWDVSDNTVSVAVKREGKLRMYSNGMVEGELNGDEFAGFPLLIIKNNERLRSIPGTRSEEYDYEFVDDAFDGREQPEPRVQSIFYYDQLCHISQPNNTVSTSELNSDVLGAYNEFLGQNNRYHRDYIYFGMTNTVDSGYLNTYIREYLYKFRFKTAQNGALYDATTESDPYYPDGYMPTSYTQKGDSLSLDQLRALDFQLEGNLEMRFHVIYGSSSGGVSTNTIACSVPFRDLFAYDKVLVEYKHETWFTRKKWIYRLDENCLVPKWCTLNIALPIPGDIWNIGSGSTSITIRVEEFDSGEVSSNTVTKTYTFSTNCTTTNEGQTYKTSYGIQNSQSISSSTTYTRTNSTDFLGEVVMNYVDPVILMRTGVSRYKMMTYDTGSVIMMIIPRHL